MRNGLRDVQFIYIPVVSVISPPSPPPLALLLPSWFPSIAMSDCFHTASQLFQLSRVSRRQPRDILLRFLFSTLVFLASFAFQHVVVLLLSTIATIRTTFALFDCMILQSLASCRLPTVIACLRCPSPSPEVVACHRRHTSNHRRTRSLPTVVALTVVATHEALSCRICRQLLPSLPTSPSSAHFVPFQVDFLFQL